jgi:hypothetical protein
VLLGVLAVLGLQPVAAAQDRPAVAHDRQEVTGPAWSASLGTNLGISSGKSDWRHEAPVPEFGVLSSRLRFEDVRAPIVGLDGDFVWRRLVVTAAGGWGAVYDGELIDEDFLENFTFSRTRSSVDDGRVAFASATVGYRLVDWRRLRRFPGQQVFVDVLVGYQWWHERYEAFGIKDDGVPSSVRVLTHEWTWHSLRVGARLHTPLGRGFGLRASGFVLPWSSLVVEDVHHLREDLAQNPSIRTEATGGFGVQLEAAIAYRIWERLGLEAGYRYWQLRMNDGDVVFRGADGGSSPALELKHAETHRQGLFVTISYWF